MNHTLDRATSRKTLTREVNLVFFQDDANGEWGLTHKETFKGPRGADGFNAFYDGQGIFHDVFEHAHEYTDKYFQGEYAMNISGEVAAMGALHFFYDTCGFQSRLNSSWNSPSNIIIEGTLGMMQEAIQDGYINFGYELLSNVPPQKETEDCELECIIESHIERLKKFKVCDKEDGDSIEYAQRFKESATDKKIADLYRYGYNMASKLCAPDGYSGQVMRDFKEFWDKFCKQNEAEQMRSIYKEITFKLYKDENGKLYWNAKLIPIYMDENTVVIKGGYGLDPHCPHLGY